MYVSFEYFGRLLYCIFGDNASATLSLHHFSYQLVSYLLVRYLLTLEKSQPCQLLTSRPHQNLKEKDQIPAPLTLGPFRCGFGYGGYGFNRTNVWTGHGVARFGQGGYWADRTHVGT